MVGLILGLIVGIGVAGIIGLFGFYMCDDYLCDKPEEICKAILFMVCALIVIIIPVACCRFEKNENDKWMLQFEATKQTIEQSLTNENLSGFERVELVKQAAEKNEELISRQYDCQKWYGFNIDERILDIKPISLE